MSTEKIEPLEAEVDGCQEHRGNTGTPRVLICVPAYCGQMYVTCCGSLVQLVRALVAAGYPYDLEFMSDSLIPRSRNRFAALTLAGDYTHLLFIDADEGFRPEDAMTLINSGLDVVACPVPFKSDAGGYAICLHEEHVRANRLPFIRLPNGAEFVEVKDAGTGFMCIRRQVFERMIDAYPEIAYTSDDLDSKRGTRVHDFFSTGPDPSEPDPSKRRYLSEDYFFCRRWQQLGGKVYVYVDAVCSHTGAKIWQGGTFRRWISAGMAATRKALGLGPPEPTQMPPTPVPPPPARLNRQQRRAMAARGAA